MTPTNKFQSRLQGAPTLLGMWLMSASATCAEALGWSGLDFVVIDMEHVPIELPQVVDIHRALAASPIGSITRVPWSEPVLVKRLLDAGVQTLMFPMIQSAADAAAAVRSTRYPPKGIRGVAAVHRASNYGAVADYLQCSGSELTVIVQVETRESSERLADIASVDGVDAVFVGPGDLAASLGHLGNVMHPEVQAIVKAAPAVCHRLGRKTGIVAPSAEQAKIYAGYGYDFVAIGSDIAALGATVKAHLHAFGRAPKAAVTSAGAAY